ncbi:MAG: ParA family protein [Deltaproteobacteria bacterium]|jgi:chromosome partitioning protein|nr:ParA family protein [Deltaproteobacteria bacterium]
MGKTIAIANQKGGVGKTTTAVNLGACLAALHFRTLLVDFDPQGNASSGVGCERDAVEHSVYDVLAGRVSARDAIVGTTVPMLDLIAAKTDLAAAEIELVGEDNREHILRDSLADVVDDYDFIVLDCPPSLSLITLNALCAANTVLIPIQAEYYALEGLARLLETIEMLKKSLNPGLRIEGMLITMHDARNNLSRQVEDEVRSHFPAHTYQTVIQRNVRLSESPSHGTPIITYDIDSRGARNYMALAKEFVERNRNEEGS